MNSAYDHSSLRCEWTRDFARRPQGRFCRFRGREIPVSTVLSFWASAQRMLMHKPQYSRLLWNKESVET